MKHPKESYKYPSMAISTTSISSHVFLDESMTQNNASLDHSSSLRWSQPAHLVPLGWARNYRGIQLWGQELLSSTRMLVMSGGLCLCSLFRLWAYCSTPVGSTLSNTSANADIKGCTWPVWVWTPASLVWGFFGVSQQNCVPEKKSMVHSHANEETSLFVKQHPHISHMGLGKKGLTFAYASSWLMTKG